MLALQAAALIAAPFSVPPQCSRGCSAAMFGDHSYAERSGGQKSRMRAGLRVRGKTGIQRGDV